MGVVFKRQHIIGEYIVDFCCLSENLIIEVDGGYHQRPDQMKDDKQREQWLRQQGFEVVRFDNDQVYNNIEEVLEEIAKTIQSKQE